MAGFPKRRLLYEDVYCSLLNGLQRFFGPMEVALLLKERCSSEIYGLDPMGLLNQPNFPLARIHSEFRSNDDTIVDNQFMFTHAHINPTWSLIWVNNMPGSLRYPPIVEQWLREASVQLRLAASGRVIDGTTRATVRDSLLSFSASAVKRSVQAYAYDFKAIHPVDVILNLSLAYEEGRKCSGRIAFFNAEQVPPKSLRVVLDPGSRPSLTNTKHLRKLMTSVDSSSFSIAVNVRDAVGIADCGLGVGNIDRQHPLLTADFIRGRARIVAGSNYICSVYEGQIFSDLEIPSQDLVERLLTRANVAPAACARLTPMLVTMIEYALAGSSGCSIVVDCDLSP